MEYTFYDFELVKTLDKVFLLKSKVNNKTYLFDEETYKDSTSVFNIEVEDANYLLYNTWYYSKEYLKLSLNGKQAIYKTGSGLITAFEFDDIEVYRYVTFFRKDNKQLTAKCLWSQCIRSCFSLSCFCVKSCTLTFCPLITVKASYMYLPCISCVFRSLCGNIGRLICSWD